MKFLRELVGDVRPLIPSEGSKIIKVFTLAHTVFFNSGVHALLFFRISSLFSRWHLWPLSYLFRKILYHGYHMDIWGSTEIGEGHWWPHPIAIVYSRHAKMGKRVKVYHNVSVISGRGGAPIIEDYVYLFAGSCVMGGVTVGRGATIGAHALVLHDVPAYGVVVGNPGKVIRYRTPDEIDIEDIEWRTFHPDFKQKQ